MKRIISVLLALVLVLAITACTKKPVEEEVIQDSETPTETQSETPVTETTPDPDAITGPINPLTGVQIDEDISSMRPYAIMMNNINIAQPQQGISKADIIYEVPVEGGITRMLAVYQDVSDVGVIGSIRSARHYYVDLVQAHDSVYIHAGGSNQAYDTLYARDITRLDGVHGARQEIFYRDQERRSKMGYEHSLMSSGELISENVPTYGYQIEHEDGFECNMQFSSKEEQTAAGLSAEKINVEFSRSKDTLFEYSSGDGQYYVSQYGGKYEDGNDQTQVNVKNVLILFTTIYQIAGDNAGRLNVELVGDGAGYYACGGKYIEITWSRESNSSQFVYKTADGLPLVFGRGSSYISIISESANVDFE